MSSVTDKEVTIKQTLAVVSDGTDNADVFALANSKSLAVAIVDGSGDQITSFAGGGGSGTEYTEDAASIANPVGGQLIARRRDTLSTETTTDGDVTALNSTGKGELYVKHVDEIPVTGPLTDTQLRATAVPVSGTVTASGPLTDTELRATAVSVSGPLTDTQLRATAVPVSGTITLGAGSAVAGKVSIDQTTPGTTNLVQVGGSLPAGNAAIGKLAANAGVNIGTVDIASITAGSNVIGKVSIDQTTPGTTNLIQVGGSLPAGTAAIGKLAANAGINIGTVDIASITAGNNIIGKTRGTSASFDVTFVLDTAAYASGDVLVVPQAISSVMSANNGTALLHSITLNDKDDQGQALDLVFLRSNVSIGTINTAVSISDANADEIYGIVSISAADWIDLGGCRVATKTSIGLLCKSASGSTDIYIGAISRGTGTYTASGITAKISFATVD